jgi:hypothetical protein
LGDLRQKEALEAEMQDPTRRAAAEAREREKRFSEQESQIKSVLAGKAVRQPSSNASEQVVYCGGYFKLQRAIDALIRADITPSADDSAMRAIAFQTLAQTWLSNREAVLGSAAVQHDLLPVYLAGLSAGLTADIENTKRIYQICSTAAEDLARERARLK